VTGMVLVLSVVSRLGAYQYMLVRDKNGPIIFGQPLRNCCGSSMSIRILGAWRRSRSYA
jgi:hypothetical protein